MLEILVSLGIYASLVILVLVVTLVSIRKYKSLKKVQIVRAGVGIVLGSGGHTTEMLKLVSSLDKKKFTPRTYFVASSDEFSLKKLQEFEKDDKDYEVYVIPRAREVGQSYLTSVFTSIRALVYSLLPVSTMNADVLLVNGPGTCLPICFIYMLSNLSGKVIYVESICRVKTLSLSCKLLRKFVSKTLVQWAELETKFPDTKYIGKLV